MTWSARSGVRSCRLTAVEVDAVVHGVIRVVARLPTDAAEVKDAGFLVDAEDLGDVPVAVGDLVLELAGGGVVEVEVAPAVALGEPEELV